MWVLGALFEQKRFSFISYYVCFYCIIQIFGMFEKCGSKEENDDCENVDALHPRLKNWDVMRKNLLVNGEFKYIELVVMFWLIKKNLVELEMITYIRHHS